MLSVDSTANKNVPQRKEANFFIYFIYLFAFLATGEDIGVHMVCSSDYFLARGSSVNSWYVSLLGDEWL